MAFFITKPGNPNSTILTDGGSVEVGQNLSVDEQGRLNAEGGGGTIDNIRVNGIEGIVENKIASVDITGLDVPVGEEFVESELVNENLEINSEEDSVSEGLGKLLKALKDDEIAITKAFLSIEESTGFNNNLEYIPEESTTLLGNAKSLQDADAILMNSLSPLIQFKSNVLDVNKIKFTGGTDSLVKIGELHHTGTYTVEIPYEGNCTNVTFRFPPATYASALYYTINTVLSSLEQYLVPPLIYTGRCITFEVSSKTWEWWQYVGPMSQGVISPADWSNPTNWKKLNISYTS